MAPRGITCKAGSAGIEISIVVPYSSSTAHLRDSRMGHDSLIREGSWTADKLREASGTGSVAAKTNNAKQNTSVLKWLELWKANLPLIANAGEDKRMGV